MADAHAERVKGIFSEIARRYDLFNALSSFGIYRSWLRRVARTASCTDADRVLDVAGGTGDVAFALCEACPPASIELTDFTPEMLEVAAERITAGANLGVPCGLNVVDAHNLPYGDEEFTVVTCAYGLRNFSDRRRAMREAARVFIGGVVTGDRSGFDYLRDSIKAFPPQDAIAQELHEAGFSQVEYENCTGGIVAVYAAVK